MNMGSYIRMNMGSGKAIPSQPLTVCLINPPIHHTPPKRLVTGQLETRNRRGYDMGAPSHKYEGMFVHVCRVCVVLIGWVE